MTVSATRTIFVTDKCLTDGISGIPPDEQLNHEYIIGSQPDTITFPKIDNGQCKLEFEFHLYSRNSGVNSFPGLSWSPPYLYQT